MKTILLITAIILSSLYTQAQGDLWQQLGIEYYQLIKEEKYEDALKCAEQMNSLVTKNGSASGFRYAMGLRLLGDVNKKLNQYDSAFFYWEKSYRTNDCQGKPDELNADLCLNNLVLCCKNIGDFYILNKNYKSAEVFYKKSLDGLKIAYGDEHPDVASGYNNLAILYSQMGDYNKAELLYQQCLKIKIKAFGPEHQKMATTLINLGDLYRKISDYHSAEALLTESLMILKNSLGLKHLKTAAVMTKLGDLYYTMSEFKSSETSYKRALEICKSILGSDNPNLSPILNNMSLLYLEMGDYSKAKSLINQSIAIREKAFGKSHSSLISNHINLGLLFYRKGDFKSAEAYYLKGLELSKNLNKNHPDKSSIYNNIGLLYTDMEDAKSAKKYFSKALKIKNKVFGKDDIASVDAFMNLGRLHYRMGDFKSAESLFLKSLSIRNNSLNEDHPDYAWNLMNLGMLYKDLGEFNNANKYFMSAFEDKLKLLKWNFSWLSEKERQDYWSKENIFMNELNLFASLAHEKFPMSVELAYNSNLVSKSLLLETSKQLDNALSKANNKRLNANYRSLKLLRGNYKKLVSEGSENKDLINRLKFESDSLDKILVNELQEYSNSKQKLDITWKKVQQNLEEGEAAIEFVRFRAHEDSAYQYQALIIRKDLELPALAPLCDESQLAQLEPRIDFGEYYPLVWRPIEKHLKDIHTIYYAPVGELYNLPFHSFLVPREKEGQRYLMDKYKLHQLTSTRYLAMGLKDKQKERMFPSISIVGGVNYDYLPGSSNNVRVNNNFASTRDLGSASAKVRFLPGTVKEAKAIESVLSKNRWETTYIQGGNAKEERLTEFSHKNAKGIMHIATHGYAFPEYSSMDTTIKEHSIRYSYRYSNNPMVRSGLVLAGGNWALMGSDTLTQLGAPENGVLTALEVSQLNLRNTKLVVLSACETGLGQIEGSEGTFGLKRGFKLAGVEQMIVSLWSVPDKETMELMTIFYTDLAQNLDPVSSFQYAQNQMRNNYPIDPEKWAGFVLVR